MHNSGNQPRDISAAGEAVLRLPGQRELQLSDGRRISIRRLDWLAFELLWRELCELLAGLPGELDEAALVMQLATAPRFVLKLAALSAGLEESVLATWEHGLVLELAAAALHFNFCETAGLRDFSGGLALLWRGLQPARGTPDGPAPAPAD